MKKISKASIKKLVIESIAGACLWTVLLTPYMLLVTKVTTEQFLSWLLMEFILIPPLAPIVFRITSWLRSKLVK